MLLEGKIKSYITERGFGFISIQGEAKDLFFHLHNFPSAHIAPKIGEKLRFCIVEDNGKLKADQIVRLDLKDNTQKSDRSMKKTISTRKASPRYKEQSRKGYIMTVIGFIVIAVLVVLVYNKYQDYKQTQQLKAQHLMQQQAQIIEQQRQALGELPDQVLSKESKQRLDIPSSQSLPREATPVTTRTQVQGTAFKCDGRTHCSQMHSYEEAVFFLRNCPGTKMDGNNDGEPCERQFGR
jgi:cold shock CspA family protein/Tfp pilus assembly protein PilE